jgi:hypothetical protein
VLSSARALPAIADAVKGDIAILADSGIRNGLDVVRMIALGADSVLLGRAYLYALATAGQAGVANLLNLIEKEMKVAMTLTGAKRLAKSAGFSGAGVKQITGGAGSACSGKRGLNSPPLNTFSRARFPPRALFYAKNNIQITYWIRKFDIHLPPAIV